MPWQQACYLMLTSPGGANRTRNEALEVHPVGKISADILSPNTLTSSLADDHFDILLDLQLPSLYMDVSSMLMPLRMTEGDCLPLLEEACHAR